MQNQENKHLICPVTQELFDDPISVPCCGQSYSRAALIGALNFKQECPMCRASLNAFDAQAAPRNVAISGLVDDLKVGFNIRAEPINNLGGRLQHIVDSNGVNTGDVYRMLLLNDASISVRPTLFIAVCDRSGSMSGQPWSQVEEALLHMIGLGRSSNIVQLG